MRATGRALLLLVGGVFVLSLLGATQLIGLVAVPAGLVLILLLLVRGGRPTRGATSMRAQRPSFLARYGDLAPAGGLAATVIAAFAVWESLNFLGEPGLGLLAAGLLVPVIAFSIWPAVVEAVAGAIGAVAVTTRLVVERDDCTDTVSLQGFLLYVGVLVVAVGVVALTRSGWAPFGRPLARSTPAHEAALFAFGLLESAAFLVHPNGLDIWADAPSWAPFVGLVLVGVIATFGGYAPRLAMALVAVAVVFGQFVLASVAAALLSGTDPCGNPALGIGYAVAFTFLAMCGLGLRSSTPRPVGRR